MTILCIPLYKILVQILFFSQYVNSQSWGTTVLHILEFLDSLDMSRLQPKNHTIGTLKVAASQTGVTQKETSQSSVVQSVTFLFPETTAEMGRSALLCGDPVMVTGTSRARELLIGEQLQEIWLSSVELTGMFPFPEIISTKES